MSVGGETRHEFVSVCQKLSEYYTNEDCLFVLCDESRQSDFHENNLEISEVTQTYGKYIYVPTVTAAEYVTEKLAKCYMLYKDPLLETPKVYFEVSSKFYYPK